jgi:hypothetical protein
LPQAPDNPERPSRPRLKSRRCGRCGTRLAYAGRPCHVCISPATFRVADSAARDVAGPVRGTDPALPRFALPPAMRKRKARLPRRERAIAQLKIIGGWTWNSLALAAAVHVLVLLMALLIRGDLDRQPAHVLQVEPETRVAEAMAPLPADTDVPLMDQADDSADVPDRLDVFDAGELELDSPDSVSAPEPMQERPEPAPPRPNPARPPEGALGLAGGDRRPGLTPAAGSGLYRNRQGQSREAAVRRFGGGDDTERAVDLGLRYLARQQGNDGSWDPRRGWETPPVWVTDSRRGALTALCTLPFLAAGHTPQEGEFRVNVAQAVRWLMRQQASDGYIGFSGRSDMYTHTVATLALCEAWGLTDDENIRHAAERAVRYLERTQSTGGGWCYAGAGTDRSDASITGWAVLALKSASATGIEVRDLTWQQMVGMYDRLSLPGGETYYADADYGRLSASRKGIGMVGVGLMSRVVLEDERFAARNAAAQDRLLAHLPQYEHFFEPSPHVNNPNFNTYYGWYNGTLGMFLYNQGQGEAWRAWNEAIKQALLPTQITRGSRRGAWRADDRWIGSIMGDLYSTACAVLCLTVYYRYNPIHRYDQTYRPEPVIDDTPKPATPADRSRELREATRDRGTDAVPALIDALRDNAPGVRGTALTELGRLRAVEAAPAVADMLGDPDNRSLRLIIFDTLARLGDRAVADRIIPYLNDREDHIAGAAASALRRLAGGQDFGRNTRAWQDWFRRNP